MIQNDVLFREQQKQQQQQKYITKYVLMRFTVQQLTISLKWKNQHFGIQSAHTHTHTNIRERSECKGKRGTEEKKKLYKQRLIQ